MAYKPCIGDIWSSRFPGGLDATVLAVSPEGITLQVQRKIRDKDGNVTVVTRERHVSAELLWAVRKAYITPSEKNCL